MRELSRVAVFLLLFAAGQLPLSVHADNSERIVFEAPQFRYVISSKGRNLEFTDRSRGVDYLSSERPSTCSLLRIGTDGYEPTSAKMVENQLLLEFDNAGVRVKVRVDTVSSGIVFRVESVEGRSFDELTFVNVPLKLSGTQSEDFGACVHALNLGTRVDSLPVLQRELRASCLEKFGITGAKAGIVAAPPSQILGEMRKMLSTQSELPVCRVAGAWADEIPFNHGSYMFNFGSLTEATLDSWISLTKQMGVNQVDNHGGGSFFRFGDFQLNPKIWPKGWESWKPLVDRLHAEGIDSILHTYAYFIDKHSKYVTPVPDPRLDAFRTFTLAQALTADETELVVNESTKGMTTLTGFFQQNSVVLHVGDELITFESVSQEAPWRFRGLKRGALGTKAAAHAEGAKARHLKEMFGLFVPNVESTLFEEIAANHADIVNRCGFDGIYLDAIDGSSILRGPEQAWYWGSKFVVEIQKRLKRPVGMEMSAMWHHFWQYRTRAIAWDYPRRGHERFIDLHAKGVNESLMLPLHLGWWAFATVETPQVEATTPQVMETLGARLIGWNAGVSIASGINRGSLKKTPLFQRGVEILRTCEEMRHASLFDEETRKKLREQGTQFRLTKNPAGMVTFQRIDSHAAVFNEAEPWSQKFQISTPFEKQRAEFRIEALASSRNGGESTSISSYFDPRQGEVVASRAAGIDAELQYDPASQVMALKGTNSGRVPRQGSWARWVRRFEKPVNLKERQGVEVEIEGDGSGAIVAIRLESPEHIGFGAVADRYITIDFKGRRKLTLIESESTRWSDYEWGDAKTLYQVYRETIDFGVIEQVSLFLQNLPVGQKTQINIHSIRAVPLQKCILKHPRIAWGDKNLTFPVEMTSGSWLECRSPEECVHFGPSGEDLGKVQPVGEWPVLERESSPILMGCDTGPNVPARARITVISAGEKLAVKADDLKKP